MAQAGCGSRRGLCVPCKPCPELCLWSRSYSVAEQCVLTSLTCGAVRPAAEGLQGETSTVQKCNADVCGVLLILAWLLNIRRIYY